MTGSCALPKMYSGDHMLGKSIPGSYCPITSAFSQKFSFYNNVKQIILYQGCWLVLNIVIVIDKACQSLFDICAETTTYAEMKPMRCISCKDDNGWFHPQFFFNVRIQNMSNKAKTGVLNIL